jgi:hypothetical protein
MKRKKIITSKKIDWDTASIYIIDDKYLKFLRDVETAVNRIAKPEYSHQKAWQRTRN